MNEILVPQQEVENQQPVKWPELEPLFLADLDVAQSSKETYHTALHNLFQFLSGSKITYPIRADLLRYKEKLCQDHTAKTVNLQLSVIRSFFSWTQFNRIYPNISYGIKGVRMDRSPKRYDLSSTQIKGILENIDTTTLGGRQKYAIVLLASTTGLRAAEISSLSIADLQVVKDTSILRVKRKGYHDKDQVMPIGSHTDGAIRSALSLRDTPSPNDPLFISTSNFSYGSRISPKGIGRILKKILKENNFTGSFYTGHSFRHSACCLGLEVTGQDLLEIKKFMGHKNLETTLLYSEHDGFLMNNIAGEIEKKLV